MAARLARDIPGAFKPDQYWNVENPAAHERTTGPELWDQTDGRITHFVASVGTGGTISGAARFLKARNPAIEVIGADPEGSVLSGDTARPVPDRGRGGGLLPGHLRPVHRRPLGARQRPRRVRDGASPHPRGGDPRRRLVRDGDRGRARGRPRPDRDGRRRRGASSSSSFPTAAGATSRRSTTTSGCAPTGSSPRPARSIRVEDLLHDRHHAGPLPDLVIARTTQRVGEAIEILQEFGISQLPVSERPDGDAIEGFVGSITEKGLLDRVFRDPAIVERTVGEVMDRPLPFIDVETSLDQAFALLSGGSSAVIATRGDRPIGVVTKLDVLEYLTHRPAPRG